ncbi:N-acetyltransferase [Actinocorallia lasiicapitis]
MTITAETPADAAGIAEVTRAAFAANVDRPSPVDELGRPVEVGLLDRLRGTDAWLPSLSLVAWDGPATADREMVGHVLGTRAWVGDVPVLALGPLSVVPGRWRRGIGTALIEAFVAEGDRLGEPLVALLGDPAYYARAGFVAAADLGISPPVAEWAPYFQVLPLRSYRSELRGEFRYAAPFMEL